MSTNTLTNEVLSPEQISIDQKRYKRINILITLKGFLDGAGVTLDGSYAMFFLTEIYLLPVAFTGALSFVTLIIALVISPIFGAFSDNFRFKKSKYWPWLFSGTLIKNVLFALLLCIPALAKTDDYSSFAILAFVLYVVGKMSEKLGSVAMYGMGPNVTKSLKGRQLYAQLTKIGHEGGKAIWGYIVPLVLVAATGFVGGDEIKGYAITAACLFAITWLGPAIFTLFGLRGSYVERVGLAQTEKQNSKRVSLKDTLSVLFTNRPTLGAFAFFFLHKVYFFIYVIYGIYVYKYIFMNADGVGLFLSVFSFASMAGVFCGGIWTKIFKDSKRCCVMAMAVHLFFTLLLAITFNKTSNLVFLMIAGASSFFMGMMETWITPLFNASAEYGTWKTGLTMNAMVLSTLSLAVVIGQVVPPIIATAFLRGTPGDAVYTQGLTTFFTIVPLVIGIISLLCLMFIYNLNDKKTLLIQEDLKNGKTQATSDLKI